MHRIFYFFVLFLIIVLKVHAQSQYMCFNQFTEADASISTIKGSVTSGDFNNDGRQDMAVANYTLNNISILFGSGSGNFSTPVNYLTGLNPFDLVSDDFNNDGFADLAVVNLNSNDISILIGSGNGNFSNAINYNVGINPTSIKSADVNADGIKDILVTNDGSNDISVLIGTGVATFYQAINSPVGIKASSLFVNDYNEDGNVDLAVVNITSQNISILIGSGTGGFTISNNYNAGANPGALISADFNGDTHLDLAVIHNYSNMLTIHSGNGSGSFSLTTSYSVGMNPSSVSLGEFNGDSFQDIVVVNRGSDDVSVLIASTSGLFMPPINYEVYDGPQGISINDFNGDGNYDIATSTSSNVCLLFGLGNGLFAAAVNYSTGLDPRDQVIADFNGDGNKDIAVVNSSSNTASVLINLGTGYFAPAVNYSVSSIPHAITANDFNNDGYIDLVVANYGANKLSILLGSNTGTFVVTTQNYGSSFTNYNPISMCTNDFNNDGKADLAVVNYGTDNVSIFKGNGNGTFAAPIIITAGSAPKRIISADFNNDGKADLAVTNYYLNTVVFLPGTGLATFGSGYSYSVGQKPLGLASGDFNNDGKLDLAVANSVGNSVSVLNGNGGGFSPQVTYTNSILNPSSVTTGDYNGDGFCDIAVANSTNDYNIRFLVSNGNGFSVSPSTLKADALPVAIGSSDFNGDSKPDLAVTNYLSRNLTVFINGTIPSITSVPIDSICPGTSSLISASGGDYYQWSNGDINSYAMVSPTTTTTYTVIGNTLYGCSNMVVNTVYVKLAPSFTVNSGNICSGESFTIIPSSAGTFTYSGGSTVVSPTINTSYTVSIAGSNDCVASEVSSVIVNSTPTISVNSGTICSGNSFTIDPSGANTYTYSSNSNIVSPITNTVVTVTGSNDCGVDTQTVMVLVNPSPTISVNSGSICIGYSFTFTPTGAMSYTYSSSSPVITPSITSTYTIIGEDINGCYDSISSIITVNFPPTLSVLNGVICSGDSYTLSAGGASSYTYSSGSSIVTPTITTTYTIMGETNSCIDSVSSTVIVNTLPTLAIASINSICINSSVNLTSSGAISYTWNTGATTSSITVTPTTTSIYTVTGTDLNNCSNTQTVSVVVDNTCQDIWPGDANSDGIADNLDVLELGLHYLQTGPVRPTGLNNSWQSFYANDWIGTITNGKNVNHSDCNGDGTINDDDTLAVFNNYGLNHAFRSNSQITTVPELSIVPDQQNVIKGTWGSSSIYLGEALTPVNNINGIAFTVNFDNTLIEPNSIWIEYPVSFINTANQNLHFRKLNFGNANLFTATTHTINNNVNGNGLVAILHYKILSSLTTDEVLNLNLVQGYKSEVSGQITPLTVGTGTLMAIGASVGLQELNGNLILVSPNPTNGSLTIKSKTELQKIEVVAVTGQVLLSEVPTNTFHTLHLDNFANGIYFINLYQNNRIVKREKVVLNK